MTELLHLLYVEDVESDAALITRLFEKAGHVIHSKRVENENEMRAALSEGAWDVVICDYDLPQFNAMGAFQTLRETGLDIPFIVVSGFVGEDAAVRMMKLGAHDYVMKSNLARLPPAVEREIREARVRRERRLADEALRDSEERLRLAMAAATEAIWEFNPITGSVYRSESYERTYQNATDSDSAIEMWKRRLHPDDRDRVWKSFWDALEGQALAWRAEYRFLQNDGEWSNIQDRAVIARDAAGKATRVVGAMLDVTNLKRAEEALEQSNQKLRQLSRDLLRTQDYERRRIARELHDSTAQLLTALSINLTRLKDPGLAADRRNQALSEAIELAGSCSQEIRTATYLLHPPLLEEVGLDSALKAYAQGFIQRTGIQVEIKIPPDFGRLSSELEAAVFGIVQEGLANVHKHSGSRAAAVGLERDPREVRLVLSDEGHGLPEKLRQSKGFVQFGVGILGMRERAEQLGGRLDLTSNDGGTTVTATLPLAP